jgi:pyrimidine operon attenuation protein/uracil phosphoribosyltransferase
MGFVLMDAADMRRTLGRLAHEILEANGGAEDLVVIGVLRRGWPIAKRLAFLMTQIEGTTIPSAKLDTRAFRDDRPLVVEDDTEIPFDLNEKRVVLVDEVIFTGRTIRAALDTLMKHGRPREVQLAVLIDRGHRELPIAPTFCGKTVVTDRTDHITVRVNEYDGEDAVLLDKPGHPAGMASA